MATAYSPKEIEFLLKEIRRNRLDREYFNSISELWPVFYVGQKRTPLALYGEMRRLSKEQGVTLDIISSPKRNRITKPASRTYKSTEKQKMFQQFEAIIQSEVRSCSKKIAKRVYGLVQELAQKNQELTKDIKELLPYKGMVENHLVNHDR